MVCLRDFCCPISHVIFSSAVPPSVQALLVVFGPCRLQNPNLQRPGQKSVLRITEPRPKIHVIGIICCCLHNILFFRNEPLPLMSLTSALVSTCSLSSGHPYPPARPSRCPAPCGWCPAPRDPRTPSAPATTPVQFYLLSLTQRFCSEYIFKFLSKPAQTCFFSSTGLGNTNTWALVYREEETGNHHATKSPPPESAWTPTVHRGPPRRPPASGGAASPVPALAAPAPPATPADQPEHLV